jgi:hypothetical protein
MFIKGLSFFVVYQGLKIVFLINDLLFLVIYQSLKIAFIIKQLHFLLRLHSLSGICLLIKGLQSEGVLVMRAGELEQFVAMRHRFLLEDPQIGGFLAANALFCGADVGGFDCADSLKILQKNLILLSLHPALICREWGLNITAINQHISNNTAGYNKRDAMAIGLNWSVPPHLKIVLDKREMKALWASRPVAIRNKRLISF